MSARRASAADPTRVVVRVVEPKWRPADVTRIRRAAQLVLLRTGARGELTILLSDDSGLLALNKRYRRISRPTNVLAFPAGHQTAGYLGDVAIAFETAVEEARSQKKPLTDHATHLAVHGVLHLLGYDHKRSGDAREMEALEVDLLKELHIANPYGAPPQ